jgi:AcrR family transcriptional regulator
MGRKLTIIQSFETFVSMDFMVFPDSAVKSRIWTAAEALFGDRGFSGVSLRELTNEARVNLAAVSYYFGGKEELYAEIVERRVRPLSRERLARLDHATAAATAGLVPLEQILEIMFLPMLEVHGDQAKGGPAVVQLFGRCLTEPRLPFLSPAVSEELQGSLTRFAQATRRHVPQLPPDEFLWRFTFVIGAMQHSLANLHRMSQLTRGICRNDDSEGALKRFVTFSATAFREAAS